MTTNLTQDTLHCYAALARSCRPRDRLTVSSWADRHRWLSSIAEAAEEHNTEYKTNLDRFDYGDHVESCSVCQAVRAKKELKP